MHCYCILLDSNSNSKANLTTEINKAAAYCL